MNRPTLNCIAALTFLLGSSTLAQGQEAWRYHPGDDSRWAEPTFDDKNWEVVEPLLAPGKLPRDGWPGTGWFRRRLQIDPALQSKPLVIGISTPGTTTVFLDGVPLMDIQASGPALRRNGAWSVVTVSPRPDHVLAVRHALNGPHVQGGKLGFELVIQKPDAAAFRSAATRRETLLFAIANGGPAFLAVFLTLLHLALFVFYPKARENLFYALAMAGVAGFLIVELAIGTSDVFQLLSFHLGFSSILIAIFFFLLTYYALRARIFPRTWIAAAVLGGALIWLIFLFPDKPPYWIWYGYFGLAMLEVIRVEAAGGTTRREGVKVLLGGFAILSLVIALQALFDSGFAPPVAGLRFIWVIGLLAVAVSMSIFLARSFGRTSLHLEQRLDEVRTLSDKVLAQERAAYEQELSRRLLEAENARKTAEIEGARALQLSMLPAKLPAVEGLETAAAMTTASEVGGDYYDFRVASDGSLVVAFGDATGHGVAAGTMVTAVKALFSTLGGGESLPAVLAECGRVLREMQVKPLHMCLTLARITPRSVTLCSAAMPPVLILRAASGEIEELGPGGPPVGSRLGRAWSERSAVLAPGDTLLFASDGFAEQLDPADNPLGDEKLAETFRSSAGLPAGEIVERLLARVAAWRGEREQGDDITLVVVRVAS